MQGYSHVFRSVVQAADWPPLQITADQHCLLGVAVAKYRNPRPREEWPSNGWHQRLVRDLHAYLTGKPVDWSYARLNHKVLTSFQKHVIAEMRSIPRGRTKTYGEIAHSLKKRGVKASARAVGQACGANPWPILVPCHRVVAANGIGGFGWGAEWKRRLLALEGTSI